MIKYVITPIRFWIILLNPLFSTDNFCILRVNFVMTILNEIHATYNYDIENDIKAYAGKVSFGFAIIIFSVILKVAQTNLEK